MKFNLSKLNPKSLDKNLRAVLGRVFAISLISFMLLGTALPFVVSAEDLGGATAGDPANQAGAFGTAAGQGNRTNVGNAGTDAIGAGSPGSLNTGNTSGSIEGTSGGGPATTGQATQTSGNSLSDARNAKFDRKDACDLVGFKPGLCFGTMMLSLGGAVLSWSGILLNKSIDLSITSMSAQVKSIPAIGFVWTAFRDLSNIFFIFVLIYIAFKTILGMDQKETMHMLIRVIIVGLLINFSLVFTKMTVDISNVVAIQFYKSIQVGDDPDRGLSAALMEGLKLTTLYNVKDPKALEPNNMFLIGLMGMIFFLVTAFVFLAAAIMFIARFVYIIILMMTSPIVFALWMMPGKGAGSAVGKWTGKLVDQLIFAPVFMMMMWVVVMVVSRSQSLVPGLQGATFVSALTGANVDSVSVILNFIVVIALTISAITIAKSAGGSDHGDKIMGWGKALGLGIAGGAVGGAIGLGGWAGRRTIGAWAQSGAQNTDLINKAATATGYEGVKARLKLNTLKGVAGSNFDLRSAPIAGKALGEAAGTLGLKLGDAQKGGYLKDMADAKAKELEYAKSLGEGKVYANEATKAEAEKLAEEKKAHDAEIKTKDAEIEAAKAARKPQADIDALEEAKLKAITDSTEKKKKLEDIHSDPSKTKTRQEAYADVAEKGKMSTILGALARNVPILGKDGKKAEAFADAVFATRGNKDAAKELRKDIDKKAEAANQKKNQAWAEEAVKPKIDALGKELDLLNETIKTKEAELAKIKPVETKDRFGRVTGVTPLTNAQITDKARLNTEILAEQDKVRKATERLATYSQFAKKKQAQNILDAINSMAGVSTPPTATPPPATPPPAPTP